MNATSPGRFRFGLRSLFMATTVVAVFSAAYRVHPLLTAVALELTVIIAVLFLAAHTIGDL